MATKGSHHIMIMDRLGNLHGRRKCTNTQKLLIRDEDIVQNGKGIASQLFITGPHIIYHFKAVTWKAFKENCLNFKPCLYNEMKEDKMTMQY